MFRAWHVWIKEVFKLKKKTFYDVAVYFPY